LWGNEDLDRLRPAFYNTSVTSLRLIDDSIQGKCGSEVIRDLLVGNNTLLALDLSFIVIVDPEVASTLGRVLADNNNRLQKLTLNRCRYINAAVLAWLLLSMGDTSHNFLTHLSLVDNKIEGADGGRQVGLLLERFRQLNMLNLHNNNLGPLGARALAPCLASSSHMKSLELSRCGLGNDGVANLIPDGQVNRTLTNLDLGNNDIRGLVGGENVVALAARCTNLDRIDVDDDTLSPGQLRRLDLLLGRKRLCSRASALAGSTFPILFRAVEEAHRHEHGLGAIFVILQNDGDDHFCNALNRAIE
jgi:hypothetical protein